MHTQMHTHACAHGDAHIDVHGGAHTHNMVTCRPWTLPHFSDTAAGDGVRHAGE
jgi:hypothetical protein